jgi:hypothetical protein
VFHSHPSSRANGRRAALQGNPSAFARDSSAFERVDFLNERQAMTHTFSDINDIGCTSHLVENRFRLNGAAAIFEIIHTQEFPARQFGGNTKEFCILHTSSFPFLLSVSAPRGAAARPRQRAKLRFRAFPARCLSLGSQFIAMPARYEFADLAHIAFPLAGHSGAARSSLPWLALPSPLPLRPPCQTRSHRQPITIMTAASFIGPNRGGGAGKHEVVFREMAEAAAGHQPRRHSHSLGQGLFQLVE